MCCIFVVKKWMFVYSRNSLCWFMCYTFLLKSALQTANIHSLHSVVLEFSFFQDAVAISHKNMCNNNILLYYYYKLAFWLYCASVSHVVPPPTSPTAKSAGTPSEAGSQDSDGAVGPRYTNTPKNPSARVQTAAQEFTSVEIIQAS